MSKMWFSALALTLGGVIAFCLYVLWMGGGITQGSSWEFASWVGGSLAAAAAGVVGCITLFVRAARKNESSGTPWPQRPVTLTRAALILCMVGLLLFGVLLGGALTHMGSAIRQERLTAGDSPPETTLSSAPAEPTGPPPLPPEPTTSETAKGEDLEEGFTASDDNAQPSPERLSLTQADVVQSAHQYGTGTYTVNARTYTETVRLNSCLMCYAEFDLGRSWTTFEAVVGLSDDSNSDAEVAVRALADGDLVFSHTLSLGQAEEISVPVEGALRLRLEAERAQGSGWVAVWAEPTLRS